MHCAPRTLFPFRRFEDQTAPNSPLPDFSGPLVRLIALQGIDVHRSSDLFRLAAPATKSMFPPFLRYFSGTVPRTLATTGSSPHGLHLLFRVRAVCHPPDRSRTSSLRVFFPFATLYPKSTTDELPTARLTFRPQCFSHSRRFAPSDTSWVYFTPLPRPGFHSRGFSRCSASSPLDDSYPRVISVILLPASCPSGARSSHPPSGC
jgi:hypothetical protein